MPPKLVPVTVLTGFLGSGKTTLLNHILNDATHKMKFAVIENEFGDVGVDEKVLSEQCEEELIEVINGCVCCTVRGDLVVALKKLYKKIKKFNALIIETTGLADPAPVAQTFFIDEEIQSMYKLDSIITVVDTKTILHHINAEKPEGVENESVEQIAFADKVILNKIDLADNEFYLEKIEKEIRSINPIAPILRTKNCDISPRELLNINAFDLQRVLDFDPEFLSDDAEHQHDTSVTSLSCKIDGEVNNEMLQRWMQRLITEDGANLYRYKGIMAVKGMDQKFVFQGVGMLFSGSFSSTTWKNDEKRESRFVFIGKNLDTELLKIGFDACCVNDELRFKVGDTVEANVGTFHKGTVIALWDEGNAYRIRLADEDLTEVWAPLDIDAYIRKYKEW